MKIREIKAGIILVRSKLPDADYVVNPYTGCEFGRLYGDPSFMGRFVGEPVCAWGERLAATGSDRCTWST